MLSFKLLRETKSVLINLLECQLRNTLSRAISTTPSHFKYRYLPTLNDPERDVEYSEPGYSHEDDGPLIQIPTRKQFREQVENIKNEFKVWKQEVKDGLESNYDIIVPRGN